MLPRLVVAAIMAMAIILPPSTAPVSADGGTRTLWLHHTHTGLTAKFTFKRNGVYDQAVLNQMNVFLADWRTKDQTHMDPALFDLLWEVYQEVGATQPYNIVSSYRAPKTNAMLRNASANSGVAENSQHMKGKAMDVFIPGVNLYKLRETAMRHQVGGVGYYPTSGSPFVHMDTGNVRAWPRMTRAQLAKVFPDGKTLHLPVDGKPLSDQGRAYAQVQWTKCHEVPCNAGDYVVDQSKPDVMVAEAQPDAPIPAARMAALADTTQLSMATAEDPVQRLVPAVEITAPLPLERPKQFRTAEVSSDDVASPDLAAWEAAGSPMPATKSARLTLATREPLGGSNGQTALAALAALEEPAPKARVLMSPNADTMITAYASDAGAQRALQMIISRETTGSLPDLPMKKTLSLTGKTDGVAVASLGHMFDQTFAALAGNANGEVSDAVADLALSRQPNQSITLHAADLVAPEIDHVNETLVEPQVMTADFWADMTEAEGYLEKSTELGPMTGQMGFVPSDSPVPIYDHFVAGKPALVASLS